MNRTADHLPKLERLAPIILLAVVFLIGAWIRIEGLGGAKRTPDESCYMGYAAVALAAPLEAPRNLVSSFNRTPSAWIYPIPLRIGYYYSLAAVAALWHLSVERAGAMLSAAVSILQLALVGLVGIRFFNRWAALGALLLLSVSPEDLLMARHIWSDGVTGSMAMALVWFCAEIVVRPRNEGRPWFAGFCVCSFYFLLLRESAVVFFGLCVAALAINAWLRDRTWKSAACLLAGAAATALCAFSTMAILCGGVAPMLEVVRKCSYGIVTNPFDIGYQNGPWYSFPIGLWVLSPLTAFGCAVAMAAVLLPGNRLARALSLNREQARILPGIAAAIIVIMIAGSIPPCLKNIRLISFIFGPWHLMAGLGLSYIAIAAGNRMVRRAGLAAAVIVALIVLCSCFADYARFEQYFSNGAVRDLNIRQLMDLPFAQGS